MQTGMFAVIAVQSCHKKHYFNSISEHIGFVRYVIRFCPLVCDSVRIVVCGSGHIAKGDLVYEEDAIKAFLIRIMETNGIENPF